MISLTGLRAELRRKATAYLFAPGCLPHDKAPAPSTGTPAARVYTQLIALLSLACFRPVAVGVLDVADMYGVRWERHELRWIVVAQFAVGTVVFVWLCWLVIARTPLDRVSPRSRLIQRGIAVVCGAVTMYAAAPSPHVLQRTAALAVAGCTVAWLAVEICRTHGVSLVNRRPPTAAERLTVWQITGASAYVCLAGGALGLLSHQFLRWLGIEGVPLMKGSQASALGFTGLDVLHTIGMVGPSLVHTVALEDVVIVAATSALLTAIRRPAWEIYTLICVIEALVHAYLGLPAIVLGVFTAGHVWLYRRYQRVLPLIYSHTAFDLIGVSVQLSLSGFYRILPGILLGAVLAGIDRYLRTGAAKESAGLAAQQEPASLQPSLPATGPRDFPPPRA
ncbi:hypothetical protein [Streptomyces acidiscabies]|uniref:CAAX amino terminal protease self-immunity n=1 Tax=Streptomyces acidiscabies TaxID=42234 RepID=A0ABU4MA42_9ACTN|nr:hypothetical protein [Streptomyces acidiscabies]MDX3024958.1 hypothetical protein [Streptomyces acidiscabies]